MGLADKRKTRFRRVHKKTRLTYATLGLLHDKRVVASPRDPLAKQLLNEIEPLPPGITAHLARELVGHDMYAALYEYEVEVDTSGRGSSGATSVLRALEAKIEDILNRVARVLKTFHVDDVVQQAQVILRTYPVESPQRTRSMYDILTEIAANIVERCRRGADQGSLNANIETHLPFGFKTLGISPKGDYRYVFEFDYTGVAGGFRKVLQLAGGKVDVKVSRYKKRGHEYELDELFAAEHNQAFVPFDGYYIGGNLGMGYRRAMMKKNGPWGGDWSEGSRSKPDRCVIDTYHQLDPKNLDRRAFVMANVSKPGAALTTSGIGLSYGAYTGMFSVVVSDKITITGELEKQYELGATVPDETEKVVKELKAWKKAIQSGKAADVPTPGVTLSMGGVTLLTGMLRVKPANGVTKAVDPPMDTKEADPHLAQVTHLLDGVAFERGSSTLTAAAAGLLDVNLAENRRLFEMDGICQVTSSTSPEFAQGRLGKVEADNQNTGLARFRGTAVEDAIRASCGAEKEGVLSRHRTFEHSIDINSQVRETLEGDAGTVLHPHADAAKEPQGQARIDAERTLYAQLRRVDIVVNGVFTLSLPGR